MTSNVRFQLTDTQLARNPAVDLKVIDEAVRARKTLEAMGVWEETGSRMINPLVIRPEFLPRGKGIDRLIAQSK